MRKPNQRRLAARHSLLLPGLALIAAGVALGQNPPPSETPALAERTTESESVSKLRKEAEADDVRAQFDLGLALWAGRGVTRDRAEARVWFERAGAAGHPHAEYMAGRSHELGGDGTVVDREVAESWYRRAAEHERLPIPDAAFRLYALYKGLPSWDAFSDLEAALDGADDSGIAARQAERQERRRQAGGWLELAAQLGSTRAFLELGREHESKDPVQALKWAYLAISDMVDYDEGDDRFPKYALFRRLRAALPPEDVLAAKRAVADWCASTDTGLWRPDQLARDFSDGHGVARDPVEAYEWFRVAETIPGALSMVPLEEYAATLTPEELERAQNLPMLASGTPAGDEDLAQGDGPSIAAMRVAAEQGDGDAAYALAVSYRDGLGTEPDMDQAVEWLEFAARERSPQASYALAELFLAGELEPPDEGILAGADLSIRRRSAAMTRFLHAGDDGMPEGYARMGQIYQDSGAYDLASIYFARAHAGGAAMGALGLGNLHFDGLGFEKDEAKAAEFFEQAAGEYPELRNWLILRHFEQHNHPAAYRWLHRDWLDAIRSGDDEVRVSTEKVFNISYGAILPDGPAFARSFADPSLTDSTLGADVEGWTASEASHVTSRESIPAPGAKGRVVYPTTIRRTYSNSLSGIEIEIEIEVWKGEKLALFQRLEKDPSWLRDNVSEHLHAWSVDLRGGHKGFQILDTKTDTASVLVPLNRHAVLSIATGENGTPSHLMALLLGGVNLDLEGLAGALADHRIE